MGVLNVKSLAAPEGCVLTVTCVRGVFSFVTMWPWQKATSEQGQCPPSRCQQVMPENM